MLTNNYERFKCGGLYNERMSFLYWL
jgi:hypothetical protein